MVAALRHTIGQQSALRSVPIRSHNQQRAKGDGARTNGNGARTPARTPRQVPWLGGYKSVVFGPFAPILSLWRLLRPRQMMVRMVALGATLTAGSVMYGTVAGIDRARGGGLYQNLQKY